MSDDGAQVVGIPMLVRKGRDYWFVLGEDGSRFRLVFNASNEAIAQGSPEAETRTDENCINIKSIAALIAKHVRLEWHGHDHADINFRSMMIAAEAIYAEFLHPLPTGTRPTGSTGATSPGRH